MPVMYWQLFNEPLKVQPAYFFFFFFLNVVINDTNTTCKERILICGFIDLGLRAGTRVWTALDGKK